MIAPFNTFHTMIRLHIAILRALCGVPGDTSNIAPVRPARVEVRVYPSWERGDA